MLTIIIVGGGIAGFTAALCLRRAGHAVHIYERSSFNREIGAAIMVPPNVSRGLRALGMDGQRAGFVTARSSLRMDGVTLEALYTASEEWIEGRFGGPWWLTHRVDLHEALKRLATETEGGHGVPVRVNLSSEVVSYDTDAPSVTLSTGEVITGDLVIAADGVHSIAVETVVGQPSPALPQMRDNFVYRFLVPTSEIAADPETRSWLEGDDGRNKYILGKQKRIVWYPCRNNEVHNFVLIFHDEDIGSVKEEDWQSSIEKSKVLERYADFHPKVTALLEKATDVKGWALLFRPPIPTWTKNRLVLTGDAAHPMLPHQGQGGAQAIEDGLALGIAMIGATRDDIPSRLAVYEKVRRPRASTVTILSNAGQDEPERIVKDASKYMPEDAIPKNPKEYCEFNFGYDVIRDSVIHMKEIVPSFGIPDKFFQEEPRPGVYPSG